MTKYYKPTTQDVLLQIIDKAYQESWNELRLTGHNIKLIPSEIGKLAGLKVLQISNTNIETLPTEIGQLINLEELRLRNIYLTQILPEIGELINLRILDLSGIYGISDNWPGPEGTETSFLKVDRLQKNHNYNGLEVPIPREIWNLNNLIELDLRGNGLTILPTEIGKLSNLQFLNLGFNELKELPSEIGKLTQLRKLVLRNNNIITLPATIARLDKLERLDLWVNPLPIPPEILGQNSANPRALLDAYFQVSRPLREAKLLLVGEGSVGKTSLVNRLLYNLPPSDAGKTVGVDIHCWEVVLDETANRPPLTDNGSPPTDNRLRVNVWDFGGQEIYHATHQFFLTHRSLYLVVLEARKDEAANRLDYWLRHVQSFAGDAPIILIVNKSDQGRLALDERGLMLKHPAIQAIVHTSCTTGEGIAELRQTVESALASLPHINDWIPLTWFEVKEKLAAMEQDTLPYDSYVQLCLEAGIEHEAAQRTLARFLHDLGAALNFQDDRRLAGTHVLNPEWVTGGIYHILNAEKLQENGLLHLDDLDNILDRRRYPPEKQPFLLEIMHKFELSVPLDRDRYLIPGLLPKERPGFDWPSGSTAALEYHYAILPAAILSRLMVRLHAHIWQTSPGQPVRWRNGLVIHGDGCRALIAADPAANRLSISLDGPTPQRRHLLAVVRAQLAEIHASFAQLEAEAWVPIPEHPGKAIPYEELLFYESEREWNPLYAAVKARIDVRALLDGIETKEERDARVIVHQLLELYNLPELHHLAFELNIDHEDLPGDTKTDLTRELVLYCQRRGKLSVLAEKVRGERPYL